MFVGGYFRSHEWTRRKSERPGPVWKAGNARRLPWLCRPGTEGVANGLVLVLARPPSGEQDLARGWWTLAHQGGCDCEVDRSWRDLGKIAANTVRCAMHDRDGDRDCSG